VGGGPARSVLFLWAPSKYMYQLYIFDSRMLPPLLRRSLAF
jgi:hypothetical protein